jgi:mono/diheme cytochrome c family protein
VRWLTATALIMLAGCGENMSDQPKYHEWERAKLFRSGQVAQTPPPGTVPRGRLAYEASLHERPTLDEALLRRGRERFEIFCVPCHGRLGDGEGIVVQRGMPHPPSFHEQRLRDVGDGHFVDVITHGHGAMYSYADRVAPADRWAITAYIRALQLSQHASAAALPDEVRRKLDARER